MNSLKPAALWDYFDEILEIPRLSKHEEKIIAYLEEFARKNNLDIKKDQAGNLLISKEASKGYEDRQIVILQSHIDMVGAKLPEVEHDFYNDPISVVEEDGWITAEGTTLGADDGIGVAAAMAVLTDDSLKHGPLECLFTVDEETGMTGAFSLEPGFMKGKILLNLDSEDEGEIFIGCAGGIDTVAEFHETYSAVDKGKQGIKITVEGLRGGHSGDEIHKGFANAIKLLNQLLIDLSKESSYFRLGMIKAGKLRNAIPREASAVIAVNEEDVEKVLAYVDLFEKHSKEEFKDVESGLNIHAVENGTVEKAFTEEFQERFFNSLAACPHGVINWSNDIEGLVETSSNLAVIRQEEHVIEIVTSQRSSNTSTIKEISEKIEEIFIDGGATVRHSDGYPGWDPNPDSEILNVAKQTYKSLFNKEPEVKAIHAGLECGLFLEKYPDLDMISFGPTIKGAHTPEERIEIPTIEMFWDFLVKVLENTPVKS